MERTLKTLLIQTQRHDDVIKRGFKQEEEGVLKLSRNGSFSEYWYKPYHLYFVSEDVIVGGDWVVNACGDLIFCDSQEWADQLNDKTYLNKGEVRYKVEASTDKSIELPIIPYAFVQYYVNVKAIGKVVVTGWYPVTENGKQVKYMHIPLTDPIPEYVPTMKDNVEALLAYLPVSPSRVPYTYHHDYLRTQVEKYSGMSRSEVANLTTGESEDELYAFCFLGSLRELDEFGILFLNTPELRELFYDVTKKARDILQNFTSK